MAKRIGDIFNMDDETKRKLSNYRFFTLYILNLMEIFLLIMLLAFK